MSLNRMGLGNGVILVTGATGFVGSALIRQLVEKGFTVRAVVRGTRRAELPVGDVFTTDMAADADWAAGLQGVRAVVHAAARVHVMKDEARDPLAEFRRVNVAGTLRLARQAAAAGVRRFVFLSSVKVNGESTPQGHPFMPDDVPAPADPYGVSKLEAEQGLRDIARDTGMEVVIIRPPLVYGPGVRANFRALADAVRRGLPLPLGRIDNRRSMVALDNLLDFIELCLEHPKAANQVFMVSDGEDLSTAELIRRMARALGRRARLMSVPIGLLEMTGRLSGRKAVVQRLCSSLQVDISKSRDLLGWSPAVSVDEGLRRAMVEMQR